MMSSLPWEAYLSLIVVRCKCRTAVDGILQHQMLELSSQFHSKQHYTSVWHKGFVYHSFCLLWLVDLITIPSYLQLHLKRLSSNSYHLTDYFRNMFNSIQGSIKMSQHDFFCVFSFLILLLSTKHIFFEVIVWSKNLHLLFWDKLEIWASVKY